MAISYKGFQMYLVNTATLEEEQYCGTYIMPIASRTGNTFPSQNTDANFANAFRALVPNFNDCTVKAFINNANISFLTRLQNILPLTTLFDSVNATGHNTYLKLKAQNGLYAISRRIIPNGSNVYDVSTSNAVDFDLYDNGVNKGYTKLTACGYSGGGFATILNYTGGNITISDNMRFSNIRMASDTQMFSNNDPMYLTENIVAWLNAISQTPPPLDTDPFSPGGTSEPGGGGGSFDDSTDVITIPEYDPVDLLNRSYGNRGFVHVYLPTQAELTALHAFMWNNSLIVEMQKMFNNVADAVISLNLLPLDFTDATPNRGNILMGLVDSQIETTIAKQQFVTLDCGTIEINEFFASYLDYSPYSKLQIYLPYIGVKDLDIDEFMNAYISVKYVIDIVSGACVAFISKTGAIDNDVVKDNPILGVLYQFAGNCALNVPISGANYAQVHAADIGALIGGAGVLGTFLTGGMSAPAAVTGILSTAANVVTSKPAISRGGSIPSTVGYMSIQKPYLILTRPRMCLPEDQNTFTGYPAYVTMTPGDTSGYTEFEIIHLENIPATDAEKNELETLMKTGVIL